ncbi:MAG TPA: selenocysteine-specific translation elongation factor [Thermoanaerobaculia bacterium]|jgi:selenocysteine-specific elongation factor|nr:selenocysteine-specific translation elongation factor [Thermoanaerobaculia bacterium]
MRRVIVGTAGHIDHGKTSLVQALTGIDCDRWAEEKARGITIDLGFAHRTDGDLQIGFIDVPGHERFLHNALAGMGGVRVMLLVVAADEGVKPQTREHLAVCSLLGIPAGLVALTKSDLVAADLMELAQLEVEELLAGTPFAGSALLPVSSVTGEGIPELERALLDLAGQHAAPPDPHRPARLPIDRAFHLKGLGVVVTGTLASGAVRPGDTLELLPKGSRARVRSIQVHGQPREVADAGERTSLQLTGVSLEELSRGMQLGTPEAFTPTTSLLARFTLLPDAPAPVRGFVPVRLHLFASEMMGRMRPLAAAGLAPGETGPVEIRLQGPVSAVRGDRFILRRPSPATTLGGGEILDPRWRRHRGTILSQGLTALQSDLRSALPFWVQEAGERGVDAAEIARRLGLGAGDLAAVEGPLSELAKGQRLIEVPGEHGRPRRWIAPSAVQRVTERARRVLKEYFQKDRLAESMPKAEAVRRILRGRAAELADVYLAWLEAQKVLAVQGDQVVLPGRSAQLTGEESKLSVDVLAAFDRAGLAPPSPGEVAQELKAKPQILEGVIRHLVTRGQLVKLPSGLILAASALTGLRRDLLATPWERFSVADFKDRFGLTRKWAIPLLEHLDSSGATRRLGDERMVVRPGAGVNA